MARGGRSDRRLDADISGARIRRGAPFARSIDDSAAHEAEGRVDQLLAFCHAVIDVEAVKLQARRLLRVHPLRAADALQLGAAWEWAIGRSAERFFHTFDGRLAIAARREGFRVVPEPA
jgi:uncharacterized protein